MLIDMRCPNCGAAIQFDDSQTTMFCPYCGGKVAKAVEPDFRAAGYYGNQAPQAQMNAVPVSAQKPAGKAKSPLSILAFVFSFTVLLSWLGAVLGIVDVFFVDKQKEKNHKLSYWAIVIGALIVTFQIYSFIGGNKTDLTQSSGISSSRITDTGNTDSTFYDGTLNLDAIKTKEKVSSGKKFTIYDEDFNDCIVEARWWDYDSTMDSPGIYDENTETLAFSIQVNDEADDTIYYAYYYSEDKEFDRKDLAKPVYSDEIPPVEYSNDKSYYDVNCSRKIKKGFYLLVIAKDSSLKAPYVLAYAEVK